MQLRSESARPGRGPKVRYSAQAVGRADSPGRSPTSTTHDGRAERLADLVAQRHPGLLGEHDRGDRPALQPLQQRRDRAGGVLVHRAAATARRRAPTPGRSSPPRAARCPRPAGAPGRGAAGRWPGPAPGCAPRARRARRRRRPARSATRSASSGGVHGVPGGGVRGAELELAGRRQAVAGPPERRPGPGCARAREQRHQAVDSLIRQAASRRLIAAAASDGQLADPAVVAQQAHPASHASNSGAGRRPSTCAQVRARRGTKRSGS